MKTVLFFCSLSPACDCGVEVDYFANYLKEHKKKNKAFYVEYILHAKHFSLACSTCAHPCT